MNNKEKIVLAIVAVAVIAGAALAATGVISLPESATTVFQKMAQARTSITSAETDVKVIADITDTTQDKSAHVAFDLNGVGTKSATGAAADTHFTLSGSEAGGTELALAGDIRFLDSLLYVRATQLPPIPIIDPKLIMNKWFMIDPVAMYKEFGNEALAAQFQTEMSASSHMPAEFYTKAYALAMSEGVVTNIAPKGDQMIGGVSVKVFSMTFNVSKLYTFVPKYIDLYNTYATTQGLTPLKQAAQTDEEKAMFQEMQSQVSVDNVTVAIGKHDYLPYHATATIHLMNLGGNNPVAGKTVVASGGVNGTVTVEATYSNYNKPATVEKPTDAVPLEQFLSGLFGGAMMEAPPKVSPSMK
jgi:hypothetical protein